MKKLLLSFIAFIGILYALQRLNLTIVIIGLGLVMACMALFHILSTPDSA